MRRLQARVPPSYHSEDLKQPNTFEDRVDSGVGYSLTSSEYSDLSLDGVRDYLSSEEGKVHQRQMERCHSHTSTCSDNLTASLQKQLRGLSIGDSSETKDCGLQSRCDSGNFSVEEPFILDVGFTDRPDCFSLDNPGAFSHEELVELFSQDEDGDT
jgi:hypothetical protein